MTDETTRSSGEAPARPVYLNDGESGRSVSRFIGFEMHEEGDWRNGEVEIVATTPLGDHLRDAEGRVHGGVILTMCDNVAGWGSGLASLPDGWVVTTNLSVRAAGASLDAEGPLRFRSRVRRAGRNAVVADISVHDLGRAGARLLDGMLTSAVLQPEGGPPEWERPASMQAHTAGELPDYYEWLGLRASGPATVELEIRDVLRNPWGILHGGVTAALVDAAGAHAVPGARTTDVMVHFLAPGRVGPVQARAQVLGHRADGAVARIEVRDAGAQGRLMALAIATLR